MKNWIVLGLSNVDFEILLCVFSKYKFFKPQTKTSSTAEKYFEWNDSLYSWLILQTYKKLQRYKKNRWIVLQSEIDYCQKMNYLKHSKEEFDGRICSAFCIKFNLQIFCQIKNIKMCKKSGTCKLFLSITKLSLASFDKKLGK